MDLTNISHSVRKSVSNSAQGSVVNSVSDSIYFSVQGSVYNYIDYIWSYTRYLTKKQYESN